MLNDYFAYYIEYLTKFRVIEVIKVEGLGQDRVGEVIFWEGLRSHHCH